MHLGESPAPVDMATRTHVAGVLPSAEMQSVYSAAPADLANGHWDMILNPEPGGLNIS